MKRQESVQLSKTLVQIRIQMNLQRLEFRFGFLRLEIGFGQKIVGLDLFFLAPKIRSTFQASNLCDIVDGSNPNALKGILKIVSSQMKQLKKLAQFGKKGLKWNEIRNG